MGEPLANYEAVRDAVDLMTDPRIFALARRQVTISTVGVIPRIKQLAEDLPVRREPAGMIHLHLCSGRLPVNQCRSSTRATGLAYIGSALPYEEI
jgi:hypothetical protein